MLKEKARVSSLEAIEIVQVADETGFNFTGVNRFRIIAQKLLQIQTEVGGEEGYEARMSPLVFIEQLVGWR